MDRSNSNEEDIAVDLESGRSGREDKRSVHVDDRASLCGASVNYVDDLVENVVIDVKSEGMDADKKKSVKEKHKKTSHKKAPKPPRPPKRPSLDAADHKLIREIVELTMLKRVRTERITALKKMKAAKPVSSSNSLFAMIFTIIFCFVILLQGISNRTSSHASLDGSPSSSAPEPGLISVQYVSKSSATDSQMCASGSPSFSEDFKNEEEAAILTLLSSVDLLQRENDPSPTLILGFYTLSLVL
ncbi:hypothetical protein QQ045_014759 [Rhodiola kirilowii]